MTAVFILLPLALLFAGIALAWFAWAVRSGQYDDLETPAVRMLFDDDDLAAEPARASGTDIHRASGAPAHGGPRSRSACREGAPRRDGKVQLP